MGKRSLHPDYRDLISLLNAAQVEFVIVGAHALGFHGCPRSTGDLDIFYRPTTANAAKLIEALRQFGMPVEKLRPEDLGSPGVMLRMGVPPLSVETMSAISGLSFEQVWMRRILASDGQLRIPIIGLDELIANKRASGRPKDLLDAANLEEVHRDRPRDSEESGPPR